MRKVFTFILLICTLFLFAQVKVDVQHFNNKNGASVKVNDQLLKVQWPVSNNVKGEVLLNLNNEAALFKSIGLIKNNISKAILSNVDPAFILTVGKRDLISQNGWNIFFDKVPLKPHQSYTINLTKKGVVVRSAGSRTIIKISEVSAQDFKGWIEITLYNGSPLLNIAAVMSTRQDSIAIVYDGGLVSRTKAFKQIAWANVTDTMQYVPVNSTDSSKNIAVKYRTIIAAAGNGSLAVFPAPHQYFYPLDEAFNLRFTWYGNNYRNLLKGYGIGIRQDLFGDNRYVPWFNAPPGTNQSLNFFVLLSEASPAVALEEVKKFTHSDAYKPLKGYKTLASHFHNEFVMKVVLANKPIPDTPNFIKVFKKLGLDMVHLGEFHYTAHPKGPEEERLKELHALFEQCQRLSTNDFLLLPGEEPNEFFGGHWLQIFPKPVYWIMSRKEGQPLITQHPLYGKVYHIGNAADMLQLLQEEGGLAWTAHPRTKGSTGYPDKYKEEPFYLSDRFLGAAWKPIPADLSQPRLGKRALDLMDDMNNWGEHKKVLAEADLFTVEPENEMYAHMNVNYLQMDSLPSYNKGWKPVVDVLQKGSFFSTTGEVLIPSFTVNKIAAGDTAVLDKEGNAKISFSVQWTFPLQFAEIISGDGKKVYRHKIRLDDTTPFGEKTFELPLNFTGRRWVRLEVWDAAVNGAFTQTIMLKQ